MTTTPVSPPPVQISISKLACPVCGRHLGETTAPAGSTVTVKCRRCDKWRRIELRFAA